MISKFLGLFLSTLAAGVAFDRTSAADEIVMTIIYGIERIDVPAQDIRRIGAWPGGTIGSKQAERRIRTDRPTVEICFTKELRQKLCQATKRNIDQPIAIEAGCEIVYEGTSRRPFCSGSCLYLAFAAPQHVTYFAYRLEEGQNATCLPVSRERHAVLSR